MNKKSQEVYQFVLEQIDSVPHLEALLLLWNERPNIWTTANVAHRLYIPVEEVRPLLRDLEVRQLIKATTGRAEGFRYHSVSATQDRLIGELDAMYRKEVVHISTIIHSKPQALFQKSTRNPQLTKNGD